MRERPNFFIVGAPKCGTTAMNEYLRTHPEVFIPEQKEIHFFGSDIDLQWRKAWTEDEYLSLFTSAQEEKRIGEASVWYLYSRKAAEEINSFFEMAKIIIMLRNPVDMLYSQHSQFLYNGNEDIASFELALEAEADRKRGRRIPKSAHFVEGLYYRETAEYSSQVKRYFDIFGRDQIHIIIFDDFKDNTAQVYKDILRFLDVNTNFQPRFKVINANKKTLSTRLQILTSRRPAVIRLIGKVLPDNWKRGLLRTLRNFNTRYVPRPPMDPDLRARLQAQFTPEIERLSKLLNRDLTHWNDIIQVEQ